VEDVDLATNTAATDAAKTFSSGRSLAAWIGLVPKQYTTGGKDRLAASPSRAIDICGGC
jgi:transposase